MSTRARLPQVAVVVVVACLAACGDPTPAVEPMTTPAAAPVAGGRAKPLEPPPPLPSSDPRLIDDCGPWTPPAATLDLVAGLGDPAQKTALLAALAALPASERIDAFRAGLRLRDDAAAIACAARLSYDQIDGWECARCVDLLKGVCLVEGSDAEFEEVRSYLGTVELDKFIDALPPLPWSYDPPQVASQLHRILREDSFDAWMKLVRHPDEDVRDSALAHWSATVAPRCDGRREDVARMGAAPGTSAPLADGPGLPPLLVREICVGLDYFAESPQNAAPPLDAWGRRWLLASEPTARDVALLIELTDHCEAAVVALGRTRSPEAIAWLTAELDDPCRAGALALAGAEGAEDRLVTLSANTEDRDEDETMLLLAALMEVNPTRAHAVIEERVLGEDDVLANLTLSALRISLVPGSESDAEGFRFRQTRLDGIAAKVATARMPAGRRGITAIVIPGARTRATAERVCVEMDEAFFSDADEPDGSPDEDVIAFLDTAAPAEFRAALRARLSSTLRARALRILLEIGDPASGAALMAAFPGEHFKLSRSPCPAVVAHLTAQCLGNPEHAPWDGLFHALGAPRELRLWLQGHPPQMEERLLAGDWRGAVHALLAALPDWQHGDVGVLRGDPEVTAYLERLRTRRDFGNYWYATGQLAASGDPAARAEYWKAMTDGRYRIMDDSDVFMRTLGDDFAATLPHWIYELRSNCCRAVTNGGDPWDEYFDIDGADTSQRTPADRAQEIWDAARGRFAWSYAVERYVIAAD